MVRVEALRMLKAEFRNRIRPVNWRIQLDLAVPAALNVQRLEPSSWHLLRFIGLYHDGNTFILVLRKLVSPSGSIEILYTVLQSAPTRIEAFGLTGKLSYVI